MSHLESSLLGVRVELDSIPVYVHTHRIHDRVGGVKFLLRHKSNHPTHKDAINQLLLILGDNISEELSRQETCAIGSSIEHVCTELSMMNDYTDYSGLTTKDTDALENAYFDLMCDWELKEEVAK
jgi:hypothetical protein